MTPLELETTARDGAFSQYDIEVILPYLKALKPGDTYLEVGVDKGRSLEIARKVTDPSVKIYGIDKQPLEEPVEGAVFLQGDSRTAKLAPINVLFIDGDHSYKGCKADIDNWHPQMAENGVILFHDCDETSPGVVKAFDEFVAKVKPKKAWKDPRSFCGMAVVEL